jgi:hypothetical protein
MRFIKTTSILAIILLGAAASEAALARGSVRFGVVVGAPLFGWPYPGPYYYPPYSYYPPAVVVPSAPTTYIERSDEEEDEGEPQAQGYWYYCANPKGYYPYVKQCPGGWQRVAPQPPSRP